MKLRDSVLFKPVLVGLIGIIIVVGIVAAMPVVQPIVQEWLNGDRKRDGATDAGQPPSHELVRDAQNRPIKPFMMRLSPTAVKGLKVACEKVRPAGDLTLPLQQGSLGYDTDHLYSLRARFQGEIIKIGEVTEDTGAPGTSEKRLQKRLLGPGDVVKKGDVLAVLWSKELGDRKVALVSALLTLYVDQETLKRQEEIARSLPEATLRASKSKVEQDLTAVNAAEASLGIARLTPEEIEDIRKEARLIQKRLQGKPETPEQRLARLREEVQKWARVELLTPQDGVIVEKNTNLNDMVDPSRDTPLFRIADLRQLLINVNFQEEYLPLLQPLLHNGPPGTMRWKIRLEAEPDLPALDLPMLRIVRSLDPNAHTAVVVGRIANPIVDRNGRARQLVVGQFVTATMAVPPGPNLVDIPTNALNEVDGESLVFVQPDPTKNEYEIRRVVVARRSRDVTQVRSKLTAEEQQESAEEVREGRRPFGTVQVGELVVTHGITEMTEALGDLVAKLRTEK
jgi:cobalt-zinc-cadmium efflux system membrane fusion protein